MLKWSFSGVMGSGSPAMGLSCSLNIQRTNSAGRQSRKDAPWQVCSSYSVSYKVFTSRIILLLLVTILSQAFFALVGSHLVAFSFLSAGHFYAYFMVNKLGCLFDCLHSESEDIFLLRSLAIILPLEGTL
jgi:hypothetical protein